MAHLEALAPLLVAASLIDIKQQRIPNVLAAITLTAGIVISVFSAGWHGAVAGVVGIAIGFTAFLPLYLLGGMGAGDVKLMAATGAFTGWQAGWAIALTLIAGMVLALVYLGILRFWPWFGGGDSKRFPYAMAISVGALATGLLTGGAV